MVQVVRELLPLLVHRVGDLQQREVDADQAGVTCLLYLAPVKSEVFILPEQVAGGHAELPAGQVQGQVHGWGGGQPGHFPHGVHYVLDVYL